MLSSKLESFGPVLAEFEFEEMGSPHSEEP